MMLYVVIFIVFILIFYIYFKYKNKGFFIYSKYGFPYIFLFLAFLLSLVSFFSYQINSLEKIKANSSDIVFVLDVSSSMLALDYGDIKRLQIAKEFVKNYILNHLSNKYGLSAFSGDAVNLLPLTTDKNLFTTFLESLDEKSILKGGTNLIDALNMVSLRFNNSQNGGAIIVLSDFETNLTTFEKQNLKDKIEKINEELSKKNIKLIFIGVGKKTGNKIFAGYDIIGNSLYKKDKNNNTIVTKFDEDFFNSFSFQKYKINTFEDIGKINIKDIPSSEAIFEINKKIDISRYLMMMSFIFFIVYLILFSYFDKKGK